MKCFNGFCNEGVVKADTVSDILQMMGLRVQKQALQDIIDEVDEDGETIYRSGSEGGRRRERLKKTHLTYGPYSI